MSNGKNQRGRNQSGGNQPQRRRRGRPQQQQQQAPRGPAMTALGESTYEAVFDHGNEGYGVWFDGVVREDPNYKQFWKGTGMRPIFVRIDEDRIIITKELDRELPTLADDARDEDDEQPDGASNGNGSSAAAADAAGDTVYTAEEAARLFATEDTDEAQPAEPDASAEAEPEAPAEDAEEAPPAPKRRTTRRRTPKPAADEDA